jgi:hypothetical protein
MSETTTTAPVATTTAEKTQAVNDSLRSPQFIVAMYGMTIAALTTMCVMLVKDLNALQGAIAGTVIATSLMPMAFYFGSSKGSQDKTTIATQTAPTTTTVNAPPATVTTTTGATP